MNRNVNYLYRRSGLLTDYFILSMFWVWGGVRSNPSNPPPPPPLLRAWIRFEEIVIFIIRVEKAVCCWLSARESYPSSVLVEAYRLLHSTAYSLHILMGHNRVLQEILKKFASSVVSGYYPTCNHGQNVGTVPLPHNSVEYTLFKPSRKRTFYAQSEFPILKKGQGDQTNVFITFWPLS